MIHSTRTLRRVSYAACCALALSASVVAADAAIFANPRADGPAGSPAPKGWRTFGIEGKYEFAVDTEVFHSAPASARMRGASNTGRGGFHLPSRVFAAAPYFRLAFWHRAEKACGLRGFIRFFDAGAKQRSSGIHCPNFSLAGAPGQWLHFTQTFAFPPDLLKKCPKLRADLVLYGDPGGTVWFDDVDFGPAPPPPPSPLDSPIAKLKPLHLDTVLVRNGQPQAVIAAGAGERYAALVAKLQQRIQQCTGAALPLLDDPTPKSVLAKTNVIALGNMATNPFIETLYRRYFTYLDLYYPGPGGHVLRSLHNPYGTGRNVIFVGGSDHEGIARGLDALLKRLKPGKTLALGWTLDVALGKGLTPPKPGQRVDTWSSLGGKGRGYGWNPINLDMALYYMTADPAYVDDMRRLIWPKGEWDPRMFNGDKIFGDLKRPLSTGYHYFAHLTPLLWDIVEESPVFTDRERLYMANELLLDQKRLNFGICKSYAQNRLLPDRHAIHEMLCVYTGARYFARSYPSPFWDERLAAVDRAFATSLATPASSTPRIQTASVLWPVPQFALYSGTDRYFEPGGVYSQRMAKWLWLGDEATTRNWSYALLHATAHVLRDGRFLSVRPPAALRGPDAFRVGQSYLSSVEPKPLAGITGLRAFAMSEPNHRRLGMNVAVDEAFEFLVFRSSVDQAKQQMFLYGYYEGSKSPPRTNAILSYQHQGVKLLRPGTQNTVTVRKDGMRESGPSYAAALKCIEDIGPLAYARTEVPDHDFSRWVRSCFVLKGRGLVVFDRIVAREAGNYEALVRWRPTRSPKPDADGLRWTAGGKRCAVLTADDMAVERDARATCFVHRGMLGEKQDRLFRSLLAVQANNEAQPAIAAFGPSAAAVRAGGSAIVGTGSLAQADLAAEGEAFVIAPDVWALVRGTRLAAAGVEVRSDAQVSLSWELSTGRLVARAHDKDVTLRFAGVDAKPLLCRAGEQASAALPVPNAERVGSRVSAAVEAAIQQRKPAAAVAHDHKRLPALGRRWSRELGQAVTALTAYGTTDAEDAGILVGTKNGGVWLLRPNGSPRWQFTAGGPVYAVASARGRGKRVFLVGSDDEHVYALDGSGRPLWTYKARVSEWMAFHHRYWTMHNQAKVRRVLPVDVDDDGKLDVFIGTGGSAIERLDEDGQPQWLFTFKYGTPMSLLAADVRADHPGKELVAGTFECSYNCVVRYIDPATGRELAGGFVARYPAQTRGPRKREPSSFAQGNAYMKLHHLPGAKLGLLRAVCGRNWNNLVMNDAATGRCLWGKSFGPGGGAYLRQFIRGLATPNLGPDHVPGVVVGLANGWVCAFDGAKGRVLWSRRMASPVTVVAGGSGPQASATLVGRDDGRVRLLNSLGEPTRRAKLNGRPRLAVFVPGRRPVWVVGTSQGELAALSPDLPDAKFGQLPSVAPLRLAAGRAALQTVGVAGGRFIAAAVGKSSTWTLAGPRGLRFERQGAASFRLTGGRGRDTSLRVLLPMQANARAEGDRLTLAAPAPGPLVVCIEQDVAAARYQRHIAIENGRWGRMRTNGPVAKTLFDGRMAFFLAQKPGDWIDFDVAARRDGDYEVWARACHSTHRGIFAASIDGKRLRDGIDQYSLGVVWTEPMLLGRCRLPKGRHALRFTVVGKAEASRGHFLGLESVALVPHRSREIGRLTHAASATCLRVDWRQGQTAYTAAFRRPPAPGAVTIGDVAFDADACAVVRDGQSVTYWELRNGLSLHVRGQALAQLDARRDACSD